MRGPGTTRTAVARAAIGRAAKALAFACTAPLCIGLAGCSDGVEIHSPLMEKVVGSLGSGPSEPSMKERQGLVIPPPMAALPEPGSGSDVAAAIDAQMPTSPEASAKAAAAAKKKAEDEACAKAAANKRDPDLQAACPGLIARMTAPAADDSAQ